MNRAQDRSGTMQWILRLLVAAGLAVDAVIHLRLADEYGFAFREGIGGGTLFRIEAAAAIIAAVLVLAVGSRLSYLVAFLVAFSAMAAVVLATYVELPSIGPVPSMYEPIWFTEKALSAIAEGVAAVAAAIGAAVKSRGSAAAERPVRRSSPA